MLPTQTLHVWQLLKYGQHWEELPQSGWISGPLVVAYTCMSLFSFRPGGYSPLRTLGSIVELSIFVRVCLRGITTGGRFFGSLLRIDANVLH